MSTEPEEKLARVFAQKENSKRNMARWFVVFFYYDNRGWGYDHEVSVEADSSENAIYEAFLLARARDGITPVKTTSVVKESVM